MKQTTPVTVEGTFVREFATVVRRVISRSDFGVLVALRDGTPRDVLWVGPVEVAEDCSSVKAKDSPAGAIMAAMQPDHEGAWIFGDGQGAVAWLFGSVEMRLGGGLNGAAPTQPLSIHTKVCDLRLEVPSHDISLMARLEDEYSFDRKQATFAPKVRPGRF